MQNVKDYQIVSCSGKKEFIEEMSNALKNGWTPFGSLSTTSYLISNCGRESITIQYTQALIKA